MLFTNRRSPKSTRAIRRAVSQGLEGLENRTLFAVVDVANFGAAVNDGRDDTAAIRAAINASRAGDTVAFRGGTYNTSDQIVAKGGRLFEGNGATIQYAGPQVKFAFNVEADSSNTTIQNFRVRGAGIGMTLGSGYTNTKILNNEIYGTASTHGIHIPLRNDGTVVSGNYIHDFAAWGLMVFSSSNSRFDDNVIKNTTQGGQFVNLGSNNSVSRNVITGITRMGFEIQQTYGLGSPNGTFNLTVDGNVIYDWSKYWADSFALSIMPQLGQNIRVTNNYLKASSTGGWLGQGPNRFGFGLELGYTTGVADNNTFVGPFYAGVASSAVNATVSNNKFYGLAGFAWGGSPSVYGSGSVIPVNNLVTGIGGAPGVPSWALSKVANPLSGVSAPVVTTPAPVTQTPPAVSTPSSTPAAPTTSSTSAGTPSGTYTWVSDLNTTAARNGYGAYEKDRSNGEQGGADGRAITIGGVTYSKGLGVHADSELTYSLGGKYDTFLSDIGLDDEVGNAGNVDFEVWADGAKLYDSGTVGNAAAKSISVDVSGKQSLTLKVTGVNGVAFDHADWAFARLTPETGASTPAPVTSTPVPSTPVTTTGAGKFLSDLPLVSSKNGYGRVELDESNGEQGTGDGGKISIDGVKYDKGIGMHGDSEAVFNLGGDYSKFASDIGIDDEVGMAGSVVFQVWGDGKLLYDSGKVTGRDGEKSFNLDVSGVNSLKLVVNSAGDGSAYDHASWGGAKLA